MDQFSLRSVSSRFRQVIVYFTIVGIVSPAAPVWAERPAVQSRMKVHDVRLDAQQAFRGMVVDSDGHPLAERTVDLVRAQGAERVGTVETDDAGRFSFGPLGAGTYHVVTSQGTSVCRLWTAKAAPPAAAKTLLVVDDPRVERGQHPLRDLYTADPVLMATVVAAAIAIPIIIHKSRDDAPPGS